MNNKFIKIVLLLALGFSTLYAESHLKHNEKRIEVKSSKNDKVFIKEYTYNASEDDSKNSSRKKAIAQLKSLLSEEVGTHIQSSFHMEETTKNGVSSKYVKEEINSLSASFTKLKIIDEKWNGVTYYVKASVKINEDRTMELLLEAIKAKASEKDVKRLNKILAEQNNNLDQSYGQIRDLQKKLLLQEINNEASKFELKESKIILKKLQQEKHRYDRQVAKQKTEISKVKKLVQKAKKRIKVQSSKACLLTKAMTKNEVLEAVGEPDSDNWAINGHNYHLSEPNSRKWNYGSATIVFKNNIIAKFTGCK